MKNFFRIFILIIISQFIGYFALAGECFCNGGLTMWNEAGCKDPIRSNQCTWVMTAGSCFCNGSLTTGNESNCSYPCIWIVTAEPTAGEKSPGNPASGPVKLTNPLTGKNTYDEKTEGVPVLLGKIINYAMGIIGSLALVMFIYGGLTWMMSGGNQEQVTKGKNTVIWAALGIALIFTSYALVRFVIATIGGVQ